MLNNLKLDSRVIDNFTKVKLGLLFPPLIILFFFAGFVINEIITTSKTYPEIQKSLFFLLNGKLSQLPYLQFNLTHLGDALVFLPLLGVFVIYAPRLWGGLISSLLISGVVTFLLKRLFAVPRPAAVFDNDSFVIIGETLKGNTSLPSGHSIATFTIMITILLAFMPKKVIFRVLWFIFIIFTGLIIGFSRVGVGSHYPFDVIIGCIIGCPCAIMGIITNNKFRWCGWVENKKYYPILVLFLIICAFVISKRLLDNNLPIYYISLLSIVVTLYLMIRNYVVKKEY